MSNSKAARIRFGLPLACDCSVCDIMYESCTMYTHTVYKLYSLNRLYHTTHTNDIKGLYESLYSIMKFTLYMYLLGIVTYDPLYTLCTIYVYIVYDICINCIQ